MAASLVVAQPLYLEGQDPSKGINLYISSPDGFITVSLTVHDTMQYIKCDASMVCIDMVVSMGAFLLVVDTKGKRFVLLNGEIMIHQPSGDAQGQATDTVIHVDHITTTEEKFNEILAGKTGQPIEVIMKGTERDNPITAEQVAAYGPVDKVIAKR